MRVGVNALFLIPGGVGGTEIYTRALLKAIARIDRDNEYFVYRNRETAPDLVPNCSGFHDRPQPVAATFRPARIAYEQLALPFAAARDRADILLNCGLTAPLAYWRPMATVFYDVQYKRFGNHLRFFERIATQTLFPLSARRSDHLFLMSNEAVNDLLRHYPFASGKTSIVPHGIEDEFRAVARRRTKRERSDERFVLAVSSLMAHKNYDNLLKSFALLRARGIGVTLKIAGVRGADTARLERMRDDLGLGDVVSFTGWIPRSDLLELFETADAFVFPSLYEGFGIPVLEALTAELPISCSDIPVLREIAGDAATYFDPLNPDSIATAISETLEKAPNFRPRSAQTLRNARFDWDENATKLVRTLRSLVREPRREQPALDVSS